METLWREDKGGLHNRSLHAGRCKFYSHVVYHGIWIRLLLLDMGITYVNPLVILGCSITEATTTFNVLYCDVARGTVLMGRTSLHIGENHCVASDDPILVNKVRRQPLDFN